MARFLVLSGEGINCEREVALCVKSAGGEPCIVHLQDLILKKVFFSDFDGLIFPGGFSFGDELGAGTILALKIKYNLMDQLLRFVADQKPILGICNGLQLLAKLKLLPSLASPTPMILKKNKSKGFIDKIVPLKVNHTHCIWTKNFPKDFYSKLPVRHGEGQFVFHPDEIEELAIYTSLMEKNQIVFQYEEDINGSIGRVAGVCDESGLILGLMPHPEAGFFYHQLPEKEELPTIGELMFKNAIRMIDEKLRNQTGLN